MLWYACCPDCQSCCGHVALGRMPLPGALEGVGVVHLNSSFIGGTQPRDPYPGNSSSIGDTRSCDPYPGNSSSIGGTRPHDPYLGHHFSEARGLGTQMRVR